MRTTDSAAQVNAESRRGDDGPRLARRDQPFEKVRGGKAGVGNSDLGGGKYRGRMARPGGGVLAYGLGSI